MLSIRVASLAVASFVLPVVAVTAQTPSEPPGIYVEQPGGELKKLAQENSMDLETKGTSTSVFTGGIVKPKHVITHSGAQAAVAVTETQPSFLFRFGPPVNMRDPMVYMSAASADMPLLADHAKDFVLVRLDVADGNRVFNSGKVQKVAVEIQNLKPREFRVRVKQPLTPGEYAFYVADQRKGGGYPTSMWAFSYRAAASQ